MIVAPGRDSAAVRCLFSTANSIPSAAYTCSLLFSVLSAGIFQRKVISCPVISPLAIHSVQTLHLTR